MLFNRALGLMSSMSPYRLQFTLLSTAYEHMVQACWHLPHTMADTEYILHDKLQRRHYPSHAVVPWRSCVLLDYMPGPRFILYSRKV